MEFSGQIYHFDGNNEDISAYFQKRGKKIDSPIGSLIIEEGSQDNHIYLVSEGTVEVIHHGKIIRVLTEGEFFGEFALFTNEPRTAHVRAKTNVKLKCYSKEDFITILQNSENGEDIKQWIFSRIMEHYYPLKK